MKLRLNATCTKYGIGWFDGMEKTCVATRVSGWKVTFDVVNMRAVTGMRVVDAAGEVMSM